MESIEQICEERDKLKELLKSFVTDIDAMSIVPPRTFETIEHGDDRYWFGPFSMFTVNDKTFEHYVEWPNLSILTEQAKEALK